MTNITEPHVAPADHITGRPRPDAGSTPFVRRFPILQNLRLGLAIAIVILVVSWAFFPSFFTSTDPFAGDVLTRLKPPSASHWFGTDNLGRDLYARVIYGTSLSLKATVIALALAFVASSIIGVAAGYLGGIVDEIIMRVMDVLLAIPNLLISLMLISAIGFGTINIAIAVGIASIASFARVMRAEVLRVSTSHYVEAARSYGAGWFGICLRHVFPHARGPVSALVAIEFGSAILSISALSFLGYGAVPPTPEWGNLVAEGRNYLATAWWLTSIPGLVIILTVLAVNAIGRQLNRSPEASR
ncbi:ABC transporter permease [Aliirhizobium smilacinae]|uniref:ABC transporter permease n=1 Tax=Aliirhizobium smilacinae TaxID=1395944 RepID=A0A5C4X8P8_9HYPH|nr:ABC transporter permease [Rhizobium smilacinae]TNM59752.1 ABC transporter permease [Rhizobium smilacinae]